jgi:sensor histidine kinase YesM
MRLREALRAVPQRTRSRLLAGLTLGTFVFSLAMLLVTRAAATFLRQPIPDHPIWVDALHSLWSAVLWFLLSPLPWQWTGDERPIAPFTRGLVQCVLFSLVNTVAIWPLLRNRPEFRGTTVLPEVAALQLAQLSFSGYAIVVWERRRAQKQAALAKGREAQWTLLQSQMSPHALLNALNGLAQLVREDMGAGRQGIRDLSEIYRQLLEHGEAQQLPLGQERELLGRFLAVEKLRLGQRLQVEWDWDPDLDAIRLPPLLLQPLVENAIKHGVAPSEAGGVVRISARREGTGLVLGVANTGRPLEGGAQTGAGLGLMNLEARLRLACGDRARFTLRGEGPWTHAEIRLEGGRP